MGVEPRDRECERRVYMLQLGGGVEEDRGRAITLLGGYLLLILRFHVVEVRGFEPLTPAVRRQCSTGLSYTPGTAPG